MTWIRGRHYWNDRRSHRVFLCFYSAIFQLTSAKFQTFAYSSRAVGSSYMKFWQEFEINQLYVCTTFRGNQSRDFGFRTRKPPRKLGVKSRLNQKRLKYSKKIFHTVVCLKIPFHPNQPTFGHDEVSWNNRRSRRVFFCFYSAIFQLTSAKFQTFAYNSRTIWSSYMKFWQQFESNKLYVCTQFRGNTSRDFGFRTWKPPRKFGVKSGLSQKRL